MMSIDDSLRRLSLDRTATGSDAPGYFLEAAECT
jgi:hypothetical protein